MKIIKPVLLGPKLIAVGPLKCFKGGTGGSTGSSSSSSGGGKGGGGGMSSSQKKKIATMPTTGLGPNIYDKKKAGAPPPKPSGETNKLSTIGSIGPGPINPKAKASGDVTSDKPKPKSKPDGRGFLDKLGTGLQGLTYGKFTTDKREVAQAEKSYNEARKTRAVNEARRLGRPVVVDGKVYKPGMQTPEEAEREERQAISMGISVKQLRDEMAAEGSVEDKVRAKQRQMLEEKEAMDRGVNPTQLIEEKEKAKVRAQERAKQDQERALQEQMDLELENEGTLEEKVKAKQKLIADENKAVEMKRQDMNFLKGAISAEEYEKRTGFAPRKELRDQIVAGRNLPKALAGIAKLTPYAAGAKAIEKIGEFGQRKLTPEVSFAEANQALIEEKAKADAPKAAPVDPRDEQPMTVRQAQKDPSLRPFVPRTGESKSTPDPAPAVAAAPVPAPEPKPEPKPVEQMTPDEVGNSIVKKEAQMIRERTLAQQLASIRGLRGVSPGQKARLLQRSQEKFDREFAPQVQLAIMKEREARRKEQLGLSEAEKDRQNALERAKLTGKGGSSSGGGASQPSWLSGLNAVATGLEVAEDVIGGLGNFLGAEGGFVSGPGTEMSDSIPARLSDGEFVIRASAVRGIGKAMGAEGKDEEREKGVDFLYKLQDKMHKIEKRAEGGEIKADPERFLKFMDKGVSHSLMKKRIQKAKIPKKEKEKLLKGLGKEPKFSEGGEAYSRPKKAFKEAIGYESESRFHDKAFKDTKDGGAKRKFRHFQMGGDVDMKGPGVVKDEFKMPSSGYGAVVSAQGDLMRRIEELERKVGK